MKLNKFFLGFLGIFAILMASCSSDDKYEWATVSGPQVYFSTELSDQYEISPDASSFNVPISRADASGAQTVNLAVTLEAGSLYSVPASVSFNAGENVTNIPVSYDPTKIEYGKYETITIKIADESATTPWGVSEYSFKAGVTDWGPWEKWNAAGTAVYYYNGYWAGVDDPQTFVYRHNLITTNLYQFKIANWGSGTDLVWDYDSNTGIVSCAPQWAADNASYGAVTVADFNYYEVVLKGKAEASAYGYFDEEQGILACPLYYYVDAGYFGADYEYIYIDGYNRADVSIDVVYEGKLVDGNEKTWVLGQVNFGADVTSANVALVPGTPTDDDIAAIAAGTYTGIVELSQSGQVRIAADGLADGTYTLVAVSFYNGEAKEVATAKFKYTAGGVDTWTLVGTGTYTYTVFFYEEEDENGDPIPFEDPGYEIYQNDNNPNTYKVAGWGYGSELIFTWDKETNLCTVPESFTGYVHPSYGEVNISDIPTYSSKYTYEDVPCVYDPATQTFEFPVVYYVEAGNFGMDYETLKVDWNAASARATAHKSRSKKISSVKSSLKTADKVLSRKMLKSEIKG